MSTRRVLNERKVPYRIQRIFYKADLPNTGEEQLWRERAARMTLDALGFTNLTRKPHEHNDAVKYARRWFRHLFVDVPSPRMVDNCYATFDAAGLEENFNLIQQTVLLTPVPLMREKKI